MSKDTSTKKPKKSITTPAVHNAGVSKKTRSVSNALGISMSYARTMNMFREHTGRRKLSKEAGYMIACSLDYYTHQVIEGASECISHKRKTITPRALALSLKRDTGLEAPLGRDFFIVGAGSMPYINKAFMPKKRSGAKIDETSANGDAGANTGTGDATAQ